MVDVQFVKSDYALPEPASDAARFFHPSARQDFLRHLETLSYNRDISRPFVATEQNRLVALGLTRPHKVLSSDGRVVL